MRLGYPLLSNLVTSSLLCMNFFNYNGELVNNGRRQSWLHCLSPPGACFVHCVWSLGANQTRSYSSSSTRYDPQIRLSCMNSSSIEQLRQTSSRTKNTKLKHSQEELLNSQEVIPTWLWSMSTVRTPTFSTDTRCPV